MCAVPSLEIHCASELTKVDFPELQNYRFSLERQGKVWVLSVYGGPEGCLCNDHFVEVALRNILERYSKTDQYVYYYPNDYRDPEMREVTCPPSSALESYPVSLETAPIRVKVAK